MTLFELKIRWYLLNVENYIEFDSLEIIKEAGFNEILELELPGGIDDESEKYRKYWRGLLSRLEKKVPVEKED